MRDTQAARNTAKGGTRAWAHHARPRPRASPASRCGLSAGACACGGGCPRCESASAGYAPRAAEDEVLGGGPAAAPGPAPAPGPAAAVTATTISTSNQQAPSWGNNGRFNWWINWATDGTSGWIVQKVENTYAGSKADGTPITNASVGAAPLYYEAWPVSSTGVISPVNLDQWMRPNLGTLGSQTSFSMTGTAYWTATDPATSGFTPGGVSNAGILLSSTSAPTGLGSALLTREAHGMWATDGSQIYPGCFTA